MTGDEFTPHQERFTIRGLLSATAVTGLLLAVLGQFLPILLPTALTLVIFVIGLVGLGSWFDRRRRAASGPRHEKTRLLFAMLVMQLWLFLVMAIWIFVHFFQYGSK